MKTKTEALEALLSRSLGLLGSVKEGFSFLHENYSLTDPDAAMICKRELANFEAKHSMLWDDCEAVGRGEFDKATSP